VPATHLQTSFEQAVAGPQLKRKSRNIYYCPKSQNFQNAVSSYLANSAFRFQTGTSTDKLVKLDLQNIHCKNALGEAVKSRLDNQVAQGLFFKHKRLSVPGKKGRYY
jgi:predicted RNA-binding protein YlxR (DUF448 family)